MDIEQIKELIKTLEDSKLNKLTFKDKNGCELSLEKASSQMVSHLPMPTYLPPAHPGHHEPTHHKTQETVAPGKFVTSPMVGTFYTSPSPQDPSFVRVGDRVDEQTVVCIIEAMKVMNEVKAGTSGVIVEVCLDTAHPVEFGTKLFRVQ